MKLSELIDMLREMAIRPDRFTFSERELCLTEAAELLSASKPAAPNIDQIHVGYRRGLRDAFSLAQGASLESDGRTPKEKCVHILHTLADLLNGSERAVEVSLAGKPSFPFPARLLNESDESLAWRVDSWHKRTPIAASPQPVAQTEQADDLQEAREILENMVRSVELDGNYSTEATCTFLRQALQCLPAAQPATGAQS